MFADLLTERGDRRGELILDWDVDQTLGRSAPVYVDLYQSAPERP